MGLRQHSFWEACPLRDGAGIEGLLLVLGPVEGTLRQRDNNGTGVGLAVTFSGSLLYLSGQRQQLQAPHFSLPFYHLVQSRGVRTPRKLFTLEPRRQ